jgi:prolipoprotein diacylglyceryltransferase
VASDTLLEVHPTQLYETSTALLIWGVGLVLLRRGWRPGMAGLVVLALLAVERFAVEILRAKDDRFLGVFTIAQIISVLTFVLVLTLILWRRRTEEQEAAQ